VLSRKFRDSQVVVHCRIPQQYLGPIEDEEGVVIRARGTDAAEGNGEMGEVA
jgi:hypothetical protein